MALGIDQPLSEDQLPSTVPETSNNIPTDPFASEELQLHQLGIQVAANESREFLTQQDQIIMMALTGGTSQRESARILGGWNERNVIKFCNKVLRGYKGNTSGLRAIISGNIDTDGLDTTVKAVMSRLRELAGKQIERKPLPKPRELSKDVFLDRKAAQREMNAYRHKVRKYPIGNDQYINIRANEAPVLHNTRWYGKAGGRPKKYKNAIINNKLIDRIGNEIPLNRGNNDMDIYQEYIEGEGYVLSSYVKGELHGAGFSTPGRDGGIGEEGYSKTTLGSHPVRFFNQNHIVGTEVSRGATMGWAIFYGGKGFEGEAIHESPSVTGNVGSHGCVRFAGAYLRRLFKKAKSIYDGGGKVVVHIIDN